jgi:hypothetical protein
MGIFGIAVPENGAWSRFQNAMHRVYEEQSVGLSRICKSIVMVPKVGHAEFTFYVSLFGRLWI